MLKDMRMITATTICKSTMDMLRTTFQDYGDNVYIAHNLFYSEKHSPCNKHNVHISLSGKTIPQRMINHVTMDRQ